MSRIFKNLSKYFFCLSSSENKNIESISALKALKIIPRKEHIVSRNNISKNALKVLYRLKKNGYESYLVGGSVRDILLGIAPKDFDIVTDATPNQIQKLFKNCRLIGRRFRIAHILFGYEVIEVTTFRGSAESQKKLDKFWFSLRDKLSSIFNSFTQISLKFIRRKKKKRRRDKNKLKHKRKYNDAGMLIADNIYGKCILQDALRRDFSINALYYNIKDFTLLDYTSSLSDIKKKQIKLIGDPVIRYTEDPVRMLRAIRFACKLDFSIEKATDKAIYKLSHLLVNVSSGRLFEEFNKLFFSGHAFKSFLMLQKYNLLKYLLPDLAFVIDNPEKEAYKNLIHSALKDLDERLACGKQTSTGFLIAVFLWQAIYTRAKSFAEKSENKNITFNIFEEAIESALAKLRKTIAMPRKVAFCVKELCLLQLRLKQYRCGRRANQTYFHPRFRAAYDLLLLRKNANVEGEYTAELLAWWDKYIHSSEKERFAMVKEFSKVSGKKRRKRKQKKNDDK